MDIKQITAINNGMSMLAGLYEFASGVWSIEDYKEYTDRHVKALKDSGVDNYIVEHFESLCNSLMPVVRQSVAAGMRWADLSSEEWSAEEKWPLEEYDPSCKALDLAALDELKAKLNS